KYNIASVSYPHTYFFTGCPMILGVVVHNVADEFVVGDYEDLIVPCNGPCGTQFDLKNLSHLAIDLYNVPNLQRFVNNNEDASQYILEQLLQGQSQPDKECCGCSDHEGYVHPCQTERDKYGNQIDHIIDELEDTFELLFVLKH